MAQSKDRLLRMVTIFYGLGILIWLTPEDSSVWLAAAQGIGGAVLTVVWLIRRWSDGYLSIRYSLLVGLLFGMLGGIGSALATAGLMFFKSALHAHVFWDYPPSLISAMLTRAPMWAAAGAFIGLGLSLLWVWQRSRLDQIIER